MRKTHLALAVAGLAVAAVTGSAFTAENTIDDTVTGYGESTITGAAVSDIDFIPLSTDSTYLDEVHFITTTELDLDPGGNTAELTLKSAGNPYGLPVVCNIGVYTAGEHLITCDTPDTTQFELVNGVGLTVRD